MAAIQQSVLGLLQSAQTAALFTTHTAQQRQQIQEQVKENIPHIEEEIEKRGQTIKQMQSNVASLKAEAAERSAAQQEHYEATGEILSDEFLEGIRDPATGETIQPSAYEQIRATEASIDKEELALARAQERLEGQYKKLKKYGGKL